MTVKRVVGNEDYVFVSKNSTPLQVVRWTEKRVGGSLAVASARFVLPAGAELIELSATQNCFINFGDVTVVATATIATDGSRLFMSGVQTVPVPIDTVTNLPFTHLAFIRETQDGTIQAEQVE